MTILWAIILFWQAALTGVLIFQWLRRRQEPSAPIDADQQVIAVLNVLESRVAKLDNESQQYQTRIQKQLSVLSRVCEYGGRLLEKHLRLADTEWVSSDEAEIRDVIALSKKPSTDPETVEKQIPTLRQVEKTGRRLKADASLSLKTLLSGQLS